MTIKCFCGLLYESDDWEYGSCPACGVSHRCVSSTEADEMEAAVRALIDEHNG